MPRRNAVNITLPPRPRSPTSLFPHKSIATTLQQTYIDNPSNPLLPFTLYNAYMFKKNVIHPTMS